MRLFSDKENKIVQTIVDIIQKSEPDSLAELQVARLLRKELNFFALKWTTDPKDEVTIYIPHSDNEKEIKADRTYFDVADYIYFLEELEDLGFIKFQNIPSDKNEKFTILYDRARYTYNAEENVFWQEIKDAQIGDSVVSGVALTSLKGWRTINTDFAKDLQRCALSIVYPLPLARNYVKNGFKTLEQIQFEQQMETALDSAKSSREAAKTGQEALKSSNRAVVWACVSAIVALLSLGLTLYDKYCNKPTPIRISHEDLYRIESAINSSHISEPLEIISNDTIVVKPVLPAQKKKL